MYVLIPYIPACSDKDCWRAFLQRERVDWPVEVYAEKQGCVCDGGVYSWGVDDFVAEVGEERLVGACEDWFLVDAFYRGFCDVFCCGKKLAGAIYDGQSIGGRKGVPSSETSVVNAQSCMYALRLVSHPPSSGSNVPMPRQTALVIPDVADCA